LEVICQKKIIILIEDLFEDIEAIYPYYRLLEERYEVNIIGPEKDKEYKGKHDYPFILRGEARQYFAKFVSIFMI